MIKFLGGVVLGVFVGALAVEIIERSRPGLLDKIREKARETAERVRERSVPRYARG